jgi:hypothetical protein
VRRSGEQRRGVRSGEQRFGSSERVEQDERGAEECVAERWVAGSWDQRSGRSREQRSGTIEEQEEWEAGSWE